MWTEIDQVYGTAAAQNCWASLAGEGWRQVKPGSDSGVTNVHLLLTLANANDKQAYVVQNDAGEITAVYL